MPAAGNGESRHERSLCLRGIDLGIRWEKLYLIGRSKQELILELYHRKLRGENLAIGRTSGDPQGIWASQSPLQIHIHGTLSRVGTKKSNGESSGELVKKARLFTLGASLKLGNLLKVSLFVRKDYGVSAELILWDWRVLWSWSSKFLDFFVKTVFCVDLRSENFLSDKLSPKNTIDTEIYVRELSTGEIWWRWFSKKTNTQTNKSPMKRSMHRQPLPS